MKCLIFRAKYLWILIGLVVCTQSFGSHAQAGGGNNTGGTNSGGNTNSPQSSPSSSSGGPSTNSGPTGVNLGASILSYEAQENISKDIALRITSSAGTIKHIFITTNLLNSGGALLFYNYIISDLVRLQGSYKKTIDDYNQRSTALNGSLFVPQNILDLAGFVKRLKTGATPTVGPGADLASQYLFGLFSPPLRQRISNYTSGPDTVLQQELIMELNWIIRRGTIYDQNIFPHVKAETQTEVTQASTEPQIVRANRNVIIDEYSPVLQKVAAPQGFIPAPTSLSDATGALTALIGLVSTTTTLNGSTVTPDEMGIIPALAQNLEGKVATTYADLYADASYADSQGSLVQQMINNGKYRAQSDVLMNQILPALPAPIAPPVAVPAAPVVPAAPTPVTPPLSPVSDPRFPNLSPDLQATVLTLVALNGAYDTLLTNTISTNLSSLMAADFYENNVRGIPENGLLYIKMLYAGGENRVKSNPLVNLFTDGPRFSYGGGAVVAYILIDSNGKIVLSGTARDLVGYEKIRARYWIWPFTKHIQGNLAH